MKKIIFASLLLTAFYLNTCGQTIKQKQVEQPGWINDSLNLRLNKIDTINKWLNDVYSRNDSLFKYKNGAETFVTQLSNMRIFNILSYGATPSSGTTGDDDEAIQAAIDAAAAAGGGIVYIPRGVYSVNATINIRDNNIVIMGQGESSQVLANGDYGDIFNAHPTTNPSGNNGFMTGLVFSSFYIESTTVRTTGSAIYTNYTLNAVCSDMRVGTADWNGNNTITMTIYNALSFDNESAFIVRNCQLYPTHYGVYVSGIYPVPGWGAVSNGIWDGLITGNTNIWGKRNSGSFVAGSAGVYVAGGNGGLQIEQSNITWFENGIKTTGHNRELFLAHAFTADDCGGAGVYITGFLNILNITGGWAAGCGRSTSMTPRFGIYVDSTVRQNADYIDDVTDINITGGQFYANNNTGSGGIYIGYGRVLISNATVRANTSGRDLVLGGSVVSANITGGAVQSLANWSAITPKICNVQSQTDNCGAGGSSTTPGGSSTQIQYNNAGAFAGVNNMTWDGTMVNLPNFNTLGHTFRVGSLGIQPFQLNNVFLCENLYFSNSAGSFKYLSTGAGALFYFQGSEGQFRLAPSGTAGALATLTVPFKVNQDGTVALGGNINTATGNYTNAGLKVNAALATFADGLNVALGTATGTRFGTATTQKLSFYNSTPIVQPSGNALAALASLGLVASPTLQASDLSSGTLPAGRIAGTTTDGYIATLVGGVPTWQPRYIETASSSTTPTPTGDARDNFIDLSSLTGTTTIGAPSGTVSNHNKLTIRIIEGASTHTLAWNAIYRASASLPLPTTTTANKSMYVDFVYNSAASTWDLVRVLDGL